MILAVLIGAQGAVAFKTDASSTNGEAKILLGTTLSSSVGTGTLGLDNLSLVFDSSHLSALPQWNATTATTAALALHFAGILGATFLFTLLPDRVLRGFDNFLSPFFESVSVERLRSRQSDPPPPVFYYDYDGDEGDNDYGNYYGGNDDDEYDDNFRSESSGRLRRLRRPRRLHRGRLHQRLTFRGKREAVQSDLEVREPRGKRSAQVQPSSNNNRLVSWFVSIYNFVTRPFNVLRRMYEDVYARSDNFWFGGANGLPLIFPRLPGGARKIIIIRRRRTDPPSSSHGYHQEYDYNNYENYQEGEHQDYYQQEEYLPPNESQYPDYEQQPQEPPVAGSHEHLQGDPVVVAPQYDQAEEVYPTAAAVVPEIDSVAPQIIAPK